MTAAALPERIARHITIQANGCWSWDRLNWAGYGCPVGIQGHYAAPHRVVYELLVGPIPGGLDLDHKCHVPEACAGGITCPHRACVNPDHVEPATRATNLSDGRSNAGGWQRRLTECVRGHRFTPENTYVCPRGKRECRICRNAASRRHKNRRKAA